MILLPSLERQGPINVAIEIVRNLNLSKFEVVIVSLDSKNNSKTLEEELKILGIRVISLNIASISELFFSAKKFFNLIKNEKPDIIHSHGLYPDFLNALLKNQAIQKISTQHNVPQDDYIMTYGKLNGGIKVLIQLWAISRMNTIVVVSETIQKRISKLLPSNIKRRIRVIYNGVTTKKRSVYFENKRKNRAVVVAVLEPRKNVGFVVSVVKEINELDLHILGKGSERYILESQAGDNTTFLGKIEDVSKELNEASFFISASKSEGLPLAAIEAMSAGAYLILSDIPQHREIIGDDEDIGMVFNFNNQSSLESLLKETLSSSENVNTDKIIERFEKNFSSEIMSRKYTDIYNSVNLKGEKD